MNYKKYDSFVNDTLMEFFKLGKTSKELRFNNFNEKNFGHLMLYNVALIAKSVFGYSIGIKKSRFAFWRLKKKLNNKTLIRYNKHQTCNIDPDELIAKLETQYEEIGLAGKVYKEYYAK